MGKNEKLTDRLRSKPKDFTWDELVKVLGLFGYEEQKTGKTGGSRRKFVDASNNVISLHKPHPGSIVKAYVINDVIQHLTVNGKLGKDE